MTVIYVNDTDEIFEIDFLHNNPTNTPNHLLVYDFYAPISNVTMTTDNSNAILFFNPGEIVIKTGTILSNTDYYYNVTIYKQLEDDNIFETAELYILLFLLILFGLTYINNKIIGTHIISAICIFMIINVIRILELNFNSIFYCILYGVIMYWNYSKKHLMEDTD